MEQLHGRTAGSWGKFAYWSLFQISRAMMAQDFLMLLLLQVLFHKIMWRFYMPNLSEYQCGYLDVYQIRHCMAIILKLLASPFEC